MKTNITISLWDLKVEECIVFYIPLSILTWSYIKKSLYFIKEQLKTVYEKIKVRAIIYSSEL